MFFAILTQIRSSLPQSSGVHIKPLNLYFSSHVVCVGWSNPCIFTQTQQLSHFSLHRAFLYLPYKAICLPLYNPPTFILKNVWKVIVFAPETFLRNLHWIVKKGVYMFGIICKAVWILGSWSLHIVSKVSTNFSL